MAETGITTAVLKGANVANGDPASVPGQPNAVVCDGIPNCGLTHQTCGREVVRGLPGGLQTSPLK
jgi:hypothetical protein